MAMLIKLLFVAISGTTMALLEIQIEGSAGWAKNLPTWKVQNKITDKILGKRALTGYFLYWMILLLMLFHLPILFIDWSWKMEFQIWGLFLTFSIIEDFMWFMLNPAYGFKNFKKEKIPWHHSWLGPFPMFYYVEIVLIVLFLFLGN